MPTVRKVTRKGSKGGSGTLSGTIPFPFKTILQPPDQAPWQKAYIFSLKDLGLSTTRPIKVLRISTDFVLQPNLTYYPAATLGICNLSADTTVEYSSVSAPIQLVPNSHNRLRVRTTKSVQPSSNISLDFPVFSIFLDEYRDGSISVAGTIWIEEFTNLTPINLVPR